MISHYIGQIWYNNTDNNVVWSNYHFVDLSPLNKNHSDAIFFIDMKLLN